MYAMAYKRDLNPGEGRDKGEDMKTCQSCGGQIVGKYFEPSNEGVPDDDGNPRKCLQCGMPDTTYGVPKHIRFKSGHRKSKKEVTSRVSLTA
jgi:uncharacterized protein with PIN domain